MRKFRLIRDLPGVKAGAVFVMRRGGLNYYLDDSPRCYIRLNKQFIEDNADWFEEISERFKPEFGDEYWTFDDEWEGYEVWWNDDRYDNRWYELGMVFRTEQQVQEAANRIKKTLMEYHKELGEEE